MAIGSGLRRASGNVSFNVKSAASVAIPTPTSVQKIARQPDKARIWPPRIGPSSGAIAITVIKVDIIWAARWASVEVPHHGPRKDDARARS